MRRLGFILLTGICLLVFVVPIRSQEISDIYTDSLSVDSFAIDSFDPDPEWYVAPEVREDYIRAPKRANANTCPKDSVLIFNIDSVLVEVTVYEYSGDTTRTMVWTVNTDGSRFGTSKTEEASTATDTFHATYSWDDVTNDWKGTAREEHTYAGTKETVRLLYIWFNNKWVADTKYTWAYDAAGLETEYTTYSRNTTTNELVLSTQRIREYNENGTTTLDIQYTAHNGTTWSAGTKKEWGYDADGNQTLYADWTISNGNWKGSSKEEWQYTNGVLTMNAKYGWANGDWSGTLKELWVYTNGIMTIYEKYTGYSNGNWIGSLRETWEYQSGKLMLHMQYGWEAGNWVNSAKEEWTYTDNKLTLHLQQVWSNGGWRGLSKEEWTFNTSGKQTLYEQYEWSNGWTITLQENSGYDEAGNSTLIENYTISNGVWTGTKKEEYTFNAAKKKTSTVIYQWTNGAWTGKTKEVWAFNAGNKQTLHEKYSWSDTDWAITLQENSGYDAAGNTVLIENYSLTNNVWKGTKKEEYTYSGTTKTSTITYVWNADSNAFVYKTWSVNNTVDTPNEKCSYNWVNNAWVGTGTRTLTTKTDGKETEKINQNWPTGATNWANRTCTTTVYSGANKTQEAYYSWINNAWTGVKRTDYHYNADNKNDTTTAYTYSNNDWVWYSRIVNTFNASGKNIMTHTAKWQNGAWVLVTMTRTDIIMDGSKQLLNAQWRCDADSVWKGVQKDTASYSQTGKKLFEARYLSWANNDWVPSYKIEHEYDEADREIMNKRMDWVKNKWQGHYLYEYEYDDQGRQTSYTYYGDWDSSTNSWEGSSKYDYAYASNGQYAQQVMYRWQNNQWVGLFRYFYTYDAANHEIEQLVQSYSNDAWQNSQLYIHEYRGSEVVKNNEYRWRNEQWKFTRRNEKIYDNDELAKLRREITGSWNTNGIVTSFIDKHYEYSCDPCVIRFVNYDGTLLESQTVDKGLIPSYSGETPTKPEDPEYTYEFAGWTPSVVPVTGNATYTATYNATKRSYTVTWLNEDGSEISHETLEYGATPQHADITKENTAEFTYAFTGWTPGIGIVTGDASYTATFSATKNSYTITWLNEDGSEIEHETLEYGATPSHADVTKESTAEYTYAFAGWTPQIVTVTGDASYTASFTATKNKYTIIFLNYDGTELQSSEVEYGIIPNYEGATPIKPADAQDTYTFAGWDQEIIPVAGTKTYTATFTGTKNSYTITWLNDDNTLIDQTTVEYGAMPQHEAATKENTAEWTYAFTGWSPAIVSVTGDASYNATFSATKNKYTITWLNEDGSEIEHETLEYGATPSHADVTKESTAEFTYAFTGWTPGIGIVTGDAEYTATFSATKNSYTITWLNEDGSEIEHETLEYGATPAHADVTKESTAEFTYTFTGWTPAIVSITGDASYNATFSATKNKYTITWLDDDNTQIDQTSVEYGVVPTHDDPAKQATAEFTYTFTGWDNTPVAVTENATYKATYSAAKNSYTITWLNDDQTSLGTTTVEYGVIPTHDDPTKQPTAQYGYTFAGWSPAISAVTGNATYKAMYTDTINQYTISWLDDTGTLVDQTKVAYGATPAHANIYKESDDQYDYTFVGWTPSLVPVTGDASYSAIFTTAGKSYTVTFYFEDGVTVLDQMTLPYGAIPSTPYIPSIPSDANHTYTFSGWSPEIAPVTGDISYVPTFTAIPNQYTVIFRNYNGKELQRKKVDYGTIPEYEGDEPSRPATNAYTWAFEGWTPELVAVIGDATYTAVYTKVMNTYTILFYDEDGTTLLDEVTVEHGQKPTTSVIPTKEADEEYRYTFAGWSPRIAKATADAEYTATYLATPKTQGLNNIEAEGAAIKVIIEDKIFIRRGGNTYSIDGQRVK